MLFSPKLNAIDSISLAALVMTLNLCLLVLRPEPLVVPGSGWAQGLEILLLGLQGAVGAVILVVFGYGFHQIYGKFKRHSIVLPVASIALPMQQVLQLKRWQRRASMARTPGMSRADCPGG